MEGDKGLLHLNQEVLHCPCRRIKDIWYSPFELLVRVGYNSYGHSSECEKNESL